MARCPYQLVGGILLSFCHTIHGKVILSFAALVAAGSLTALGFARAPSESKADFTLAVMPKVHLNSDEGPLFIMMKRFSVRVISRQIKTYRQSAWHSQKLMGRRPSKYSATPIRSLGYANWVLALWQQRSLRLQIAARQWMGRQIHDYRENVEHWRRVMGQPPLRALSAEDGIIEQRFVAWRKEAGIVWKQYANPPHKAAFDCLHRHEASNWHDRDSGRNGHTGGIQFGYSEWNTYGYPFTGKQYAYQASPLEQIWAGEHYHAVSGFSPWSTASICGLL